MKRLIENLIRSSKKKWCHLLRFYGDVEKDKPALGRSEN